MNSPTDLRQSRRKTLKLLGIAGASAMLADSSGMTAAAATASCAVATPQVTEGPYWVEERLFRSDIRTDPSTGVARAGVPLTLSINVLNSSAGCTALTGAYVDVWHCDAIGIYSDEPSYNPGGGTGNVTTTGQRFLRGYQITDSNGQVQFTTIYPGWYSGRTIHIHVRIRTYNGSTVLTNYTTQIFFDEAISNTVLAGSAYKRTTSRDTTNSNDNVYGSAPNNTAMLATLTASGSGYTAAITIDLSAATTTSRTPTIAPNGIVNAASGAAGATPGAWISIYGSNLATSTYTVAATDVVAGYLPTTIQNVSVLIGGKSAYVDYVSPTQLNVLTPADSTTGQVQVSVVNANGTATAVTTTLQAIQPGLFALNNYILAVRVSDGAIIMGSSSVKAGDVLELYGTGFGPTITSVTPGLVFSGAYPTTNTVTVKIGGVSAPVSFAGLVGAGLYQINVTVPGGLTAGDNSIVATVAGLQSQSGGLMKIEV